MERLPLRVTVVQGIGQGMDLLHRSCTPLDTQWCLSLSRDGLPASLLTDLSEEGGAGHIGTGGRRQLHLALPF
jgi:hypothetical protein